MIGSVAGAAGRRRAGWARLVSGGVAAVVLESAGFQTGRHIRPAGEPQKALAVAGILYDHLAEFRADRRTVVVAIGGGVIVETQARRHARKRPGVIAALERRAQGSPVEALMATLEPGATRAMLNTDPRPVVMPQPSRLNHSSGRSVSTGNTCVAVTFMTSA